MSNFVSKDHSIYISGKKHPAHSLGYKLSYEIKDHQPRRATAHSGLEPPVLIISEEKTPAGHPDGGIFLMEVPSFQMAKLTKKLTSVLPF